jgi:hypothetical protein
MHSAVLDKEEYIDGTAHGRHPPPPAPAARPARAKSRENREPPSAASAPGAPSSTTRPLSISNTRSYPKIALRSCAIWTTVVPRPPSCRARAAAISAAVDASTEEVHSSKSTRRDRRSSARARQTSCCWPVESWTPWGPPTFGLFWGFVCGVLMGLGWWLSGSDRVWAGLTHKHLERAATQHQERQSPGSAAGASEPPLTSMSRT